MHGDTPAGYDGGNARYPVFYLLHGGGDDDSGWSTIGRAGFIMDNLLAANKAKPMIVVMPNGSMPRSTRSQEQDRFAEEFLKRNAQFFEAPGKTNKMIKLFWIGVGEKDTLANASAKNLVEILKTH